MKKTLVVGASLNPARYAYLAVQKLRAHRHEVIALGRESGQISDVSIQTNFPKDSDIDTVTLYLSPPNQALLIEPILALRPKRILFNPGTENESFARKAKELGIETEEACTLVLLQTNQY